MITYKLRKTFPPATVYGGYIVMIVGLINIPFYLVGGLLACLIGAFISLSWNGVQIDIEQRAYKSYTRIYGFKFGKWQSVDDYPHVSILKSTQSFTAHSRANIPGVTGRNTFYQVCLLDENHRKKLPLKNEKDQEAATATAKDLAMKLGLSFTKYAPIVSAKTQMRRRK